MKKIFSAISYGLLFTSIGFAQDESSASIVKESAINYLKDKTLKTKSYEMLEYNDKGLELSKIGGRSHNSWHITIEQNEVILQLRHKGVVMDSYTIKEYNLSTQGVLYLSTSEDNLHFWFYDDYILLESRDDEVDIDDLNPAHSLTRFFFS